MDKTNASSEKSMLTGDVGKPILEPWNIKVTDHALLRYRERCGNSDIDNLKAAHGIRQIIALGKEMVLKSPLLEVKHMLKHDMKKARYFKFNKLIAVLEDDVLITCHLGEADRWKPL